MDPPRVYIRGVLHYEMGSNCGSKVGQLIWIPKLKESPLATDKFITLKRDKSISNHYNSTSGYFDCSPSFKELVNKSCPFQCYIFIVFQWSVIRFVISFIINYLELVKTWMSCESLKVAPSIRPAGEKM